MVYGRTEVGIRLSAVEDLGNKAEREDVELRGSSNPFILLSDDQLPIVAYMHLNNEAEQDVQQRCRAKVGWHGGSAGLLS